MKLLVALAFATGCTSGSAHATDLAGAITCGSMTCGSGEICFSEESGSQCLVNPDAGIGQYQEFGWSCGPLPADCGGVTRDCFPDRWDVVSEDGRYVIHECI